MDARDLMDEVRRAFVDANTSPTRSITYTRSRDSLDIPLNSFVGGGQFNKEEKDTLDDYQSFSGLKLDEIPNTNSDGDTILYDGVTFRVKRYAKLGSLYTVYAKKTRHQGRPK